jgi:hypothetical protein
MSAAETLCAPPATQADQPGEGRLATDELDRLVPAIARAERRLLVLQDLTDLGMRLARVLVRQAEAEAAPAVIEDATARSANPIPAPAPRADPAGGFAKLSRAVRLTVNLEERADKALLALLAGEAPALAARAQAREHQETAAAEARRTAARDRVNALVNDVIDREAETIEASIDLEDALNQRLDRDEAYEDLENLPLGATIERLCEDLGLKPDWRLWTGEGWIKSNPVVRQRCSPFNRKSRKPLVMDDEPPD